MARGTVIMCTDNNSQSQVSAGLFCSRWLDWKGALLFYFFFRFIYLYLERGEEKEKEGERNIHVQEKYWLVASHTPPNGDLTHNPGVCPDWELNLWPFGSQAALNPLSHTSHGRNPTFQRKHWMSFCYSCLCLCVHVCDMYIYAMGYIL